MVDRYARHVSRSIIPRTRRNQGLARIDETGDLIVSPLPAEQVPAQAAALAARLPQNSLARALQEYGRLVRAIYLYRYIADEELRCRVRRQLNKDGDGLAPRGRDDLGAVGRAALCLALVTNAAVLWNMTYLGDALAALRADGYPATDDDAAHLMPAQHDHINFYGTYSFDLETEFRREGHRPLRSPAALAIAQAGEVEVVRGVLAGVPAGTEAAEGPPTRHRVQTRDHLGQQGCRSKCHRRYQRAELDALGDAG